MLFPLPIYNEIFEYILHPTTYYRNEFLNFRSIHDEKQFQTLSNVVRKCFLQADNLEGRQSLSTKRIFQK